MYENQAQITHSIGGPGMSPAFNKFNILEELLWLDEQYSACFVLIWTAAVSELVMGEACSMLTVLSPQECGKSLLEIWPPPGDQNGNWAIQLLFGGRLSFMLTQLQFMGPRGEQAGSTEAAFTNKLSVPKGEVFTAITAPYLCVARFSLHLHLDLLLCY